MSFQNCHKVTANKDEDNGTVSGTKAHYLHETSFVTHGKVAHSWDNSTRQSQTYDSKTNHGKGKKKKKQRENCL